MPYRPPLHVYVVYHPGFADGSIWADQLVRWLFGDPDVYAMPPADVPTFIWTSPSAEAVPQRLPWADADSTVVILLVDDVWMARRAWRDWATTTAAAAPARSRVVTVAVTANALNLGHPLATLNAVRVDRTPAAQRVGELRLRITHLLAKLMLGAHGSRVFLSHAKSGGRDFALAVKAFLNSRPLGTTFFDEISIEAGEDFEERLEDGLCSSVVVVLLTDRFSARYWCGWEVVTAKLHRRPMVLVDALEEGEPASLAYAGNLRTIRCAQDRRTDAVMHEAIIAGALLELLRHEHNRARVAAVQVRVAIPGPSEVLGCAPELATLPPPNAGETIHVLHPDPPLPAYELELIRRHRPDVRLASLGQALAGSITGEQRLVRRRIAISISDGGDSESLGLLKLHQERLWTRLATHLLAAGAELAYGGDLRGGGYTDQLWDLVRGAIDAGGRLPDDLVHCYLGWPIALKLTDAARAELPSVIQLHELPRPAALGRDEAVVIPPRNLDPTDHFAWTASMAEMRRQMASECDARVMVGGQFRSVSPVPGLVDEFLTFARRKPVYMVGAFGGMTRVIIRALLGESPAELTHAFQEDGGKRAALMAYYQAQVLSGDWPDLEPLDYPGLVKRLNMMGISSLNNGLTTDENTRLFWSRDLLEIISLVLLGLNRSFAP